VAKAGEGPAEALRALQVLARAVRIERIRAISQLRALVVTAPDELRSRLHGLPKVRLCQTVARFRIADPTVSVDAANRYAMRSLGRRAEELRAEAKELRKAMAVLVDQAAPGLLDVHCVGPDTAATLVVTAGANPSRLRSEASFAKLCGSAPLEASTGGVVRHRLSRAGDRQANSALYRIAIVRMAHDTRTRDYVTQRTAEGKSKLETIRCLKRYIARELYPYLQPENTT
jgi:transposase